MFTTEVQALAVGTKFMCADTTHIYCVKRINIGHVLTVVAAENLTYGTARIMRGDIRVMPLYNL